VRRSWRSTVRRVAVVLAHEQQRRTSEDGKVQRFAEIERAAATWGGKDPIRNAMDYLPPEVKPMVDTT
jgi:hypothetical protein